MIQFFLKQFFWGEGRTQKKIRSSLVIKRMHVEVLCKGEVLYKYNFKSSCQDTKIF